MVLQAMYLAIHFKWKKLCPDVRVHIDSWKVTSVLASLSGDWEEKESKIANKDEYCRGMWLNKWEWARSECLSELH